MQARADEKAAAAKAKAVAASARTTVRQQGDAIVARVMSAWYADQSKAVSNRSAKRPTVTQMSRYLRIGATLGIRDQVNASVGSSQRGEQGKHIACVRWSSPLLRSGCRHPLYLLETLLLLLQGGAQMPLMPPPPLLLRPP